MAAFWNPPALLAIGAIVAAGAAAYWYGLGPALRRARSGADLTADLDAQTMEGVADPAVPAEQDEVWGEDDPRPPAKRPYTYPPPRPVDVGPAAPPIQVHPVAEASAVPLPASPTMIPPMTAGTSIDPIPEQPTEAGPSRLSELHQERLPVESNSVEGNSVEGNSEEEPSLADFYRPRRPPPSHTVPGDEKHAREDGQHE